MRFLLSGLPAIALCGCAHPLPPAPAPPPAATAQPAPVVVSTIEDEPDAGATPVAKRDREIAAMVASVRPARMRADVAALAAFGTRHSLSATDDDKRGIGAARRWLKLQFAAIVAASGGRLSVDDEDYTAPAGKRIPKPWPMQNVLAVLPGTAKGAAARTLVVSGHYDSRASDIMDAKSDAPGANDDASGVAVVLEACRALAPYRFKATIVFAAVSGEEQGLFGSTALAKKLANERVEGMITNDIVGQSVAASGRSDKHHVRLFSAGLPADAAKRDALLHVGATSDGPDRELARAIDEAAQKYVKDFSPMLVFRADRYLRGGDQMPFHTAGVPAVRFTEVDEDFHHQHQDVRKEGGIQYGDLPRFVDADYMANVARVDIAALASLARASLPPKEARLDVRHLAEDTTVLFTAAPGVDYEVVARPTSAPSWTRHFPAGQSGSVTVPLSKDHWLFGVRAVDKAGHRSPAVFPLPLREGDAWPPAADAGVK